MAGGSDDQRDLPPPPPPPREVPTLEELHRRDEEHRRQQNHLTGRLVDVMETLQGNQGVCRGYLGFLQTSPLVFSGGRNPMAADHWLRTIEQKFTLIQCTKEEKVNFAAHQLQESAGAWWHDYQTRLQLNKFNEHSRPLSFVTWCKGGCL